MDRIDYNDVFYVASLIEYISRQTLNKRSVVAEAIGIEGVLRLTKLAGVNHCLPFEQVSDEVISRYDIPKGNYDSVASCKYKVPSYLEIGAVYAKLVVRIEANEDNYPEALYTVLTSGIADAISNFNSALFYSSSDEMEYIYRSNYASE